MRASDHLDIVEAAYSLELPHEKWQAQLTELVAQMWGNTCLSFVFDARDPDGVIRSHPVAAGPGAEELDMETALDGPIQPSMVAKLFHHGTPFDTLERRIGAQYGELPDFQAIYERAPVMARFAASLRTLDPSRQGLVFCLAEQDISARERQAWNRIGCHIAVAYRLRRALGDSASADEALGEAVLDLEGCVQHAEGEAQSETARDILREAARSVVRARARTSREPGEALALWRGLVSGQWSLVDRFDSDGKHFLVAHRNPPEVRDHRALTVRESQVAAYLAMGFTNKLIGYTLGLSSSSVADYVASLSRKLRAPTRVELVRLLVALAANEASEQ